MVGAQVEGMVAELAKVIVPVVGKRKEEEDELGMKNGWMGVEVGVVSSWSECW
jgi:hypothetical protein